MRHRPATLGPGPARLVVLFVRAASALEAQEADIRPAPRTPALVESYIDAVVGEVPESFEFPAFYRNYVDTLGISVLGSEKVPDEALLVARDIVNAMLAARPDLRRSMIERNWRVASMAETEITADIPDHPNRKRPGAPPGEPVTQQDIDPELFGAILAAYENAQAQGRYRFADGPEHYAMTNANEYWAEGVQWWFWSNYGECWAGGVRAQTPKDLEAHDPTLFELLSRVFDTHRIALDVFHARNIPPRSREERGELLDCSS